MKQKHDTAQKMVKNSDESSPPQPVMQGGELPDTVSFAETMYDPLLQEIRTKESSRIRLKVNRNICTPVSFLVHLETRYDFHL